MRPSRNQIIPAEHDLSGTWREPIAPFDGAAVSAGTPLSFDRLQPRVTQFPLTHDRDRIPSKPAIPFQQRRWTLHAPVDLGQHFMSACDHINKGRA